MRTRWLALVAACGGKAPTTSGAPRIATPGRPASTARAPVPSAGPVRTVPRPSACDRSAVTAQCTAWGTPRQVATVAGIRESSGLAASRTRPRVLYTIEDSANPPVVEAVDLDGHLLARHRVIGATNTDWEALASGPCPAAGGRGAGSGSCLYIGDIGDNQEKRDHVVVYAVAEPPATGDLPILATWTVRYPDGPHNAETLLVHPRTGAMYVVTKAKSGHSGVYRFGPPGTGTLVRVGMIDLSDLHGDSARKLTGGEWDAAGDRLVLRTYKSGLAWATDACAAPDWTGTPTPIDLGPQLHGESVAFTPTGDLVTTSEAPDGRMPIWLIPCTTHGIPSTCCPDPP